MVKIPRYTENPTLNEDSKPHKKVENCPSLRTRNGGIGKQRPMAYTRVIHRHHSQPPTLLWVKLRTVWHKEGITAPTHHLLFQDAPSNLCRPLTDTALDAHLLQLHKALVYAAPKSGRCCKHLQFITLDQDS